MVDYPELFRMIHITAIFFLCLCIPSFPDLSYKISYHEFVFDFGKILIIFKQPFLHLHFLDQAKGDMAFF